MDTRHRILVVGKSADVLSLVKEPNVDVACYVDTTYDLDRSLELLSQNEYSAMIVEFCEQSTGDMDCLRKLHAAAPHTRIILLVSNSTSDKVIEAIREQVYCYFSRPFDERAVLDMLSRALIEDEWSDGIQILSGLPGFLSLRLRCSFETADRIVQFMKEISIDISPAERDRVAQAFREMLLNAIEHGGKLNRDEWVRVSCVKTRRALVYHIMDPGEGFSFGNLAHAATVNSDPVEHIERRAALGKRPGGFGILITSQLIDEVIYNQQGNEVVLIKYLV